VKRLALTLGLVLMTPSVALAREPVISYVDAGGTFRLYDAETDTDVNPPPPVPANFAGFRYGMSLNGRFVFFNDAAKKLHLLDRATNTQVPLPGIDVYTNPGGLTVSDTGLLAFEDNGNGPALVYSSATGAFADSGLAANNGHRQTRLSGDARFLVSTCLADCIVDLGSDSNPYVQSLATRLDTGFPDDNARSEEHPCIDGDGSVVGLDKGPMGNPDIHLFDRSVAPPQAISIPGVNLANRSEAYCQLDAAADYLGFSDFVNGGFSLYSIRTQTLVTLPAGQEFDNRSQLTAPYTPPVIAPAPPPTGDVTKPNVSHARMTKRRFRVRRRATAFRFSISEPADVQIVIRRRSVRGRRLGAISRADLSAGANMIRFSGRLRGRRLKPGRYVAVLTAVDAAGNHSVRRMFRFTVIA
jgi:hypothetical protein